MIGPVTSDDDKDPLTRLPSTRRIARGGVAFIGAKFAAQIFLWGVTLYVTTLLQPADFGLLTLAAMVFGLAEMFVEAGMGRALIQATELHRSDIAQAFTTSIIFAAVFYVLIYFSAPWLAKQLNAPLLTDLLRVIALSIWLTPLQTICGALIERRLLLSTQSVIVVTVAVTQGLLVFVLAYAGLGVWSLAAGVLGGRLCQCLLVWYASGWCPHVALPKRRMSNLIRYGMTLNFGSLIWFANSNADFAVIAMRLGATALGYYSLAFQIISMPADKLAASVNQIAFAVYCRLQSRPDDLARACVRVISLLFAVTAPTLIGLALVAGDALPMFMGAQWQPTVLPLQLLAPTGCMIVVASTLPPLLNALGRPELVLFYSLVRLAIFPFAFLLMGWIAGVVGVCIAWLTLMPIFIIGLVHLTESTTGVGLRKIAAALTPTVAAVAVMSATVLSVRGLFPPDAVAARLAASILSGVLVYVGTLCLIARQTLLAEWQWLYRLLAPTP